MRAHFECRGYQRIGENITKGIPDIHEAIDVTHTHLLTSWVFMYPVSFRDIFCLMYVCGYCKIELFGKTSNCAFLCKILEMFEDKF